ncbi:NAD(P)-dependent alcohol dehydrogenase [Algoriphagus hitonicola]|uniref:NADPH:quinone reductase n=1 Tax=Algoriphagus hitonicola TaxID=435880 RepID=A0A1I2NJY6_9BACT|nr:NAD(P)-dependent alcohol dehydrogenase [Algoriphagus hitonicola]SFG03310.1 NADPH:quinone reductase [Algoriphagus hitonicola]
MKAVYRTSYTDSSGIVLKELPIPEPQSDEIQIKVIATSVSRTDLGVLTGWPWIMRLFVGWPKPRNPIPGTDFTGKVTKVGNLVSDFDEGEMVWGMKDNGIGSHAEYFCTGAFKHLQKLPQGIDPVIAAACIEGAHYAINFINKLDLQPEDRALVIGGTGGIGSAAIQLLKAKRIHVTAVSLGQVDRVKALGADRVINGLEENFLDCGEQFHAILDAVGKSRFTICKPLLYPKGSYLSSELGPNWENIFLALTTPILSNKKVIFPLPQDLKGSLSKMSELLLKKQFNPLIDRVISLAEIQEAYSYVSQGKKIGNVIVKMDPEI